MQIQEKGPISKGKDSLPTTIVQGTFVNFRGSTSHELLVNDGNPLKCFR